MIIDALAPDWDWWKYSRDMGVGDCDCGASIYASVPVELARQDVERLT